MSIARYLIALALVSPSAFANEQSDTDTLLGASVRSRPRYDGADDRKLDLVPVVRYSKGPFFARTTQLLLEGGARMALGGGVTAGVQIAYEPGPQDGDPGASLGGHVEWTTRVGPAPLNLLARFRDQGDSDRGRQLDARFTIGVYGSGGVRAGLFGQATWASEKHLLAYYDVRDSGLLYTSIGALGSYDLSSRWLAVGTAELRRLGDAPSRSAFVQNRNSTYISAGIAYRF